MMLRMCSVAWVCLAALMATGCCADRIYCGSCFEDQLAVEPCADCGHSGEPCASCGTGVGRPGLLTYAYNSLTCGAGCGELYVHPWINDPPEPCDPCDDNGNWIGHGPCLTGCADGSCPGAHSGNWWGYRLQDDVGQPHVQVWEDGAFGEAPYDGEIRDVQMSEATTQVDPEPVLTPMREDSAKSRPTVSHYFTGLRTQPR